MGNCVCKKSPVIQILPPVFQKQNKHNVVKISSRSKVMKKGIFENRIRRIEQKLCEVPRKIVWKKIEEKMQRMYDRKYLRVNRLKSLRTQMMKVRGTLKSLGFDQSKLFRGTNALQVTGVIYVIYSLTSKEMYVGQTLGSSIDRYKKHVNAAYNKNNSEKYNLPVAEFIRKEGYNKLCIAPLEVIPYKLYHDVVSSKTKDNFRKVATPREEYWINRLHSYAPKGLNVAFSQRHTRRKHSSAMIWKRVELNQGHNGASRIIPERYSFPVRVFGSRDYVRRINHLIQMASLGKLREIKLQSYLVKHLWKMYHVADEMCRGKQNGPAFEVAKLLKTFLHTRQFSKKPANRELGPIFSLDWKSKIWQSVPLRRIFCMPHIVSLFPCEFPDNVLISKKLPSTIATRVYNFAKTARDLAVVPLTEGACDCHIFSTEFRVRENCVYTGDLSIVKLKELRNILSMGSRFRTRIISKPIEALAAGLESFVERMSNANNIDASSFMTWKAKVLEVCAGFISRNDKMEDTTIPWTKACTKYLQFLHKHLVLCPVDKAGTNSAFICRKLYMSILHKELNTGGAYSFCRGVDASSLVSSHTLFLKKHVLSVPGINVDNTVGYLYFIPKLHKLRHAERFICGMANCSTTLLSKVLSKVLGCILQTLRQKDNVRLAETGVRRFFVVNGYEEVANFLHRWLRSGQRTLYTGDFSTMYTTIPHDDLLSRMEEVLNEAWKWEMTERGCDDVTQLCLQLHKDGSHVWVKTTDRGQADFMTMRGNVRLMSLKSVVECLKFLLANVYVLNGKVMKRQVIGIPMGTNCAPNLANLYLYSYESEFINRLEAKRGRDVAAQFHMSFRYIDDTLSVDNPYWRQYVERKADPQAFDEIGGIYPSALTLNDTTVSKDEQVNFLGMKLQHNHDRLHLSIFDKRNDYPFVVLRYPHMCSLIPSSIPYSVLTGQLYRFSRICTTWQDFLDESAKVIQVLLVQGCEKSVLYKTVISFLVRNVTKEGRFGKKNRRMAVHFLFHLTVD